MNKRAYFWEIYAVFYDSAVGDFHIYRHMNDEVIKRCKLAEDSRTVNLGCGTGNLERAVAKTSKTRFSWKGYDIARIMLSKAKDKVKDDRFSFQECNLDESLSISSDSVDEVISVNTIYALQNPTRFLSEVHRILKPGGTFLLVNPKERANMKLLMKEELARSSVSKVIFLLLKNIIVFIINILIAKLAAQGKYHFMSEKEIESALSSAGLKVEELSYVYANQSILVKARKK